MLPRHVLPALACAVVVALTVTAAPDVAPSRADDLECSVTTALPSRVAITGRTVSVPLAIRESVSGCLQSGSVTIQRSDLFMAAAVSVANTTVARFPLTAMYGVGRYRAVFDTGADSQGRIVTAPDSNVMTAKFATRATRWKNTRISHRPKSRKLRIHVTQMSRSGTWSTAKRRVQFQKQTHAGWRTVRTVTTARNGDAAVVVRSTKTTRWRARVLETSSAWGTASNAKASTRIPVPVPPAPAPGAPTPPPTPTPPAPEPAPAPPAPAPPAAPPAAGAVASASALLDALPVRLEDHSKRYDRDLFGYDDHLDADHDGCWTRKEVLIRDSLSTPDVSASCAVYGRWTSLYDGVTTSDANDLQIDHLVPLAEAWYSGADDWSHARQVAFGNDLGYVWDLQAVTAESNQAKGAGDPADWMPSINQCTYVKAWVGVKYRWGLAVDPREKSAIGATLAGCSSLDVVAPGAPDIAALTGGAA